MYTPAALFSILLASMTLALPVPQLAGEGAACDAILSDTDNAIGYGIKNAEDKVAGNVASVASLIPHSVRRQLAGEGAACNSIFSSTDNGIGYGIKNAEDNIADSIKAGSGSSNSGGTSTNPPPPPPPPHRRQLDKIANGFQDVSTAVGAGASTSTLTQVLDTVDGETTSGAANLGSSVGQMEESALEQIGSVVPRRNAQLDKIANGFQDISSAAGTSSLTSGIVQALDEVDGETTSGAADLGATIGGMEESILESVGNAVP